VNTTRLKIYVLLAALICGAGCVAPKAPQTPDPLLNPPGGWHIFSRDKVSKAITDDYQDYIQKLPPEQKYYVQGGDTSFFEDNIGQHAVKISIPLNGTWSVHFLIYGKNNVRIKVIKYNDGTYRS
jgi:hypothetical protein